MRKLTIRIWSVLAILSGPIAAAGDPHALSEGRQVLPRTLVPTRYELSLIPNAEALTFKGVVQITGDAPAGGRQMVVNDARALLPCWDEPALKATFAISVTAPAAQMAVSTLP